MLSAIQGFGGSESHVDNPQSLMMKTNAPAPEGHMSDADDRVRRILASPGDLPPRHEYERLIAALLKTDSVIRTLSDFGWDPLATAPLADEIEATLKLSEHD